MNERELIKSLRELRTVKTAPALFRAQTRERILAQAEVSARRDFRASERWQLAWVSFRRQLAPVPVVSLLVLLLAVAAGAAPFSAAVQSSVPGGLLYGVKRGVERVELSFRATPESQGLFQLSLAQQRLQELSQIPTASEATRVSLLRDYNIALGFAQASLQASAPSSQVAIQYNETTDTLSNQLHQVAPPLAGEPALALAQTLTDQLSGQALAMLIAAHQSGANNGVLPADVAERLAVQISRVETKLDNVDGKINQFPATKRTTRVVLESRQTIVPVTEAAQVAKQSLTEAKALVQTKQFSLALEKVQEGEAITLQTEAAVDKVNATAPAKPNPTDASGKVEGASTNTNTSGGAPAPAPDSNTNTSTVAPAVPTVDVNANTNTPLQTK